MWLKQAGGNLNAVKQSFFLDVRNQHFEFTSDVGYILTHFSVEGSALAHYVASELSASAVSRAQLTSGRDSVPTTSSIQAIGTRKTNVIIKIVQASVKRTGSGRVEFTPSGQAFIEVTDSTANVHYLNHAIKEKWGEDYCLVTGDGIKIEDSSGTQGRQILVWHAQPLMHVKGGLCNT